MLCLSLLVVLCFWVVVEGVAPRLPRKLQDEDASRIPSLDDEQDFNEMQCSACQTTIVELLAAFKNVKKEFALQPEKLREFHLLAATSDVCDNAKLHMGLLRSEADKRITTDFGNELHRSVSEKHSVVKGGWITSFWMQECHSTLDQIEDDLTAVYNNDGRGIELCPICARVGKPSAIPAPKTSDL